MLGLLRCGGDSDGCAPCMLRHERQTVAMELQPFITAVTEARDEQRPQLRDAPWCLEGARGAGSGSHGRLRGCRGSSPSGAVAAWRHCLRRFSTAGCSSLRRSPRPNLTHGAPGPVTSQPEKEEEEEGAQIFLSTFLSPLLDIFLCEPFVSRRLVLCLVLLAVVGQRMHVHPSVLEAA